MALNALTSVYRGIVWDTGDPENLFRVRLKVPEILGDALTGWAWPVNSSAAAPALGNYVYVEFENGDPNNPIYHMNAALLGLGSALPLDNNTARVTPPAAGSSGQAAHQDHIHPRRAWLPKDHGLLAWTEDVGMIANATSTLSGGVLNMNMLIPAPEQIVLVNLDYLVVAAGVSPAASQCPMGVYKSDGTTATLIATTLDQGTNLTVATSFHKVALTVVGGQSLTVPAGMVLYTAVLWNGTTGPTLGRVSSNNLARNYGLSAGSYRSCNSGSGQTALPTTITLSGTTTSSGSWQGVS